MNSKNKILILVDYRGQFWLKSNFKEENFDINLLKDSLKQFGYEVTVATFSDLDFFTQDYQDTFVIYQSSEDPDSFYKSYIEDCLLSLELKGAILIPNFILFRAHNNKVFMEMLRDVKKESVLHMPRAKYFGTYESYRQYFTNFTETKVFKMSEGAQSKTVFLLKEKKDFTSKVFKHTRSFNFYYWLVDKIKPFLKKKYPNYIQKSHNRKKFILQDFIPGLNEDYKVLVFDRDYFVLKRSVRENDFRASGSGLLNFTKDLPEGILEYSKNCFDAFEAPFISLDIAVKEGVFYLIEFQFVHFGNYTLEHSSFHYHFEDGKWNLIEEKVILEEKFAESIHNFIVKR